MGKRTRGQPPSVVANRIRQGRGAGLGADYKPWLYIHDVPSRGICSRVRYNGRVMHTFSGLEKQAAHDFMWNPAVTDINEQKNLPVEDTLRIAGEMGFEHPVDVSSRTPYHFTTDFVVHVRGEDGVIRRFARSVKPKAHLELGVAKGEKARAEVALTLAKLEVERRYWSEQGVSWALLTDVDLSSTRCDNIARLLDCELDPDRPTGFWQGVVEKACQALAMGQDSTLDELGIALDDAGVMTQADFTQAVVWLCAERHLVFDMDRKFDLLRPASDFAFARSVSADVREAA